MTTLRYTAYNSIFIILGFFLSCVCLGSDYNANNPLKLTIEEEQWLKSHPVIHVTNDPDYPPFEFNDKSGETKGISIEYLRLVEKKLGIHFKLLNAGSWADALLLVKSGEADMVTAVAETPERAEYLLFTSPYAVYPDIIFTRKDSPVSDINQLKGKSVATVNSYAVNDFLANKYPDIKLATYPNSVSVLKSLSFGEVDAAILNMMTGNYILSRSKAGNVLPGPETGYFYKLSFASRKDWPELNSILGKALATITHEERLEISGKWMAASSVTKPKPEKGSVIFTDKEKQWLASHPVIKIAPDPDFEPIEFFDKNFKYRGIAADYVSLMEEKLGIQFKIVRLKNWEDVLDKAKSREVHMFGAATKTPERSEYMRFTKPFIELPSAIIVRKSVEGILSMEDLAGKKIAAISGYAGHEYLKNNFPNLEVVAVPDLESGLNKVSFGMVDALISNLATTTHFIEKQGITNLRVAGETGYIYALAFASRKDWPELNSILEKGLAAITEQESQAISRKWIAIFYDKGLNTKIELIEKEKAWFKKHKTFRILTEEFPPYNFTDNGKIKGISTDIVREILKRAKHPDNIEVMPWMRGYRLIQKEDNIILFSTTRSPIREDLFKWVGPLVPNNTTFFAKKGSGISLANMDDARKVKSIGVYKDDFGELLLKEKGFTNYESVVDNRLNVQKLVDGKIDLWIANELTGKHIAMEAGLADEIEKVYEVQKDYMYMAFSKSTPDSVIQEWQRALDEMKSDGTFGQIFSEWIMLSYSEEMKPKKDVIADLTVEEKEWFRKHLTFRVLTEEFPPYNFTEDGKVKGISTDIVREIFTKMDYSDNIEVLPWSTGYGLVQNEDNIILFSTTRSPIREDLFKWVGPLVPNNQALFARKGSGLSISNLEDAKKVKSIGVYKDDFGEILLNAKGFTNLDSVVDNKLNVEKLAKGEIDLWLINELTGKHMASQVGLADKIEKVYEVQKDYMYMAFSKSTPDSVIEKWQDALDEIKADGTFAQIFSEWIMFSYSDELKPGKMLTKAEKAWLKDHPVIKASFDPNWPPVEWIDDNGIYVGLTKDYVDLMRKKLGLNFEIVHLDNWSDVINKVEEREIDMIIAAAPTPRRKEFLLFTGPYLNLPSLIVVNTKTRGTLTMEDLKGKTVSIVSGFASQEFVERNYPEVKLDLVSDTLAGLLKVSFGKSYAMIVNNAVVSYYVEKEFIPNLRIAGKSGYVFNLSFASRKDWPVLNTILKKGVSAISPGERQAIFQKWVSLKDEPWRPGKELIIAICIIFGILVVGAIVSWSWSLKKQVNQRTKELKKELVERKRAESKIKRAYAAAEAANRAKSDFLANMSHEIRTPMNGVIGMVELLIDTELSSHQRNYARGIQRSADSLLTIINDILDFSKIEAGKLELEPISFDLQAAVEDIAHLLTVNAERKGIQFMLRCDPDIPQRVVGDSGRIRQIITNLVANAIKFTHKGHVMINVQCVSRESENATFRFSIEDTGIGIDPEKIKHIFDKFAQEDTSTTRKYGGTGLGLAICKQLVQLMDGEIKIKSKLGEGSVFSFIIRLPLDTTESPVVKRPRADLKGLRVLVVDDNAINRQIYYELLKSWHISCDTVDSGQAALQRLRTKVEENEAYNLALVDFFMPGMDGETLAKAIKTDPLIMDTLLIMLTSGSRPGASRHLEGLGFAGYLEKPVRRIELMETLSIVWAGAKSGKPGGMVSLQVLEDLRAKEDANYINKNVEELNFDAHILLVEDNVVNQEVALENLHQLGCTVDLAENGLEAVKMVEKHQYDAVLMDCQMPVMDGFESTKEIRNLESGERHVPIIAMTANALKGDRERCLEAGMDDYISKPVRQKAMMETLLKYCKTRATVPSELSKILVVDDEKGTLEIISQNLMERFPLAYIKTTTNSVQACVLIGSYLPDILITDIAMPGINGVEIVKFVRTETRYNKIKIIVFSGLEANDSRMQSLKDLEVTEIVAKPDYAGLLSAVDGYFKPVTNRISSDNIITEQSSTENAVKKDVDEQDSVFSISSTLSLAGGNVKRMKRLIDITLEDSKKQMKQLHESLAADEKPVVERIAHTLKGQAANLGAEPFRKFALRIEQTAKAGDLNSIRDMMDGLDKEYQRLHKALEEIDWDSIK